MDRENEAWQHLVLSGRATQSITLTSVLIRCAIGFLAAITTSMTASIAVECHGIPKATLAEVSIARFTNNGPQSFKKLLPGTALRGWIRVCMGLLFLLVAASQFSSTLLVTDLQLFQLSSFPKHISYGYKTGTRSSFGELPGADLLIQNDEDWSRTPAQPPIFVEYSEPGQRKANTDDTGLGLRAFIPIDFQSQREAMRSFNGMARIFDSRVVCVQPKFSVEIIRGSAESDEEGVEKYIKANITANLANVPHLYHLKAYHRER